MSLNIYPVIKYHDYKDYEVKINGKTVELNTARVSKYPFNRRWPGHQRQIEQSELINFISFELNEAVTIEIKPKTPFKNVVIRPKSLGIKPQITDNGCIVFSLKEPAYFTVEPHGRKNALHIFADPVSDYDVDKTNENILYFGKGEHNPGTIELKSGQTLFIDEGAVVFACVKAIDAENIKIIGRGILDNSKNKEVILFEANERNNTTMVRNVTRQHTVQLEYCDNITIDGITIRNSLVYNIRPMGCKNLKISNVKVIGCWRYNSDGIDMHNCENVIVDNCFLRTFDDAICVKGFDCYTADNPEEATKKALYRNGKNYDTFKNVRVSNCTIWSDWGKCLEIGAETRAEEISDIVFENCDIVHVSCEVLDCLNVDYADVHDIVYQNINIEYDDIIPEPLIQKSDEDAYENIAKDYSPNLIDVVVSFHKEYSGNGARRGRNRDISFKNIRLYGRHFPKLHFAGFDETYKTENVTIENLYWNDKPVKNFTSDTFMQENFTENIQLIFTDNI